MAETKKFKCELAKMKERRLEKHNAIKLRRSKILPQKGTIHDLPKHNSQ